MASDGFDRRGERKDSEEEIKNDFVEVPRDIKKYVLGRSRCGIDEIEKKSRASIRSQSIKEEGFWISGNKIQRECAKKFITEKVKEIQIRKSKEAPPGELVEVPKPYKGLVFGKWGKNLIEISRCTGAEVIRRDGEVYIISGTEKQREQAKLQIKVKVAGARLRGLENEYNKFRVYIDGWKLPENSQLKLERVGQDDRAFIPEPDTQYRLKPADDNMYQEQENCMSSEQPTYLSKLECDALECLGKIKQERETKEDLKADMWCHFGKAFIRGPEQDEADQGKWSIDAALNKFKSSEEKYWKVALKSGVELNGKIFEKHICNTTPEDYADYEARYEVAFVTPCSHQVMMKVWVTKKNVGKKLEDIPVPLSDVKNILKELEFKDEATRFRCRGWLILPSRKYLQADILFPGCPFDCRLNIRGRIDFALATDYVPKEEVIQTLAKYLSELTLTEERGVKFCRLPEKKLPQGFHVTYKRCSKRSVYEIWPGFTTILSKESSWRTDGLDEDSRESTDLHLHCKEWDTLLNSKDWEPEKVTATLPKFFQFVKKVQEIVVQGELPPEILARGPVAVEAYKKALADGKTITRRVPIMLIGQDRAGKTSLKKSLKGICFDPHEDSTIGIDVDPSHFKVSTDTWKTGVTDQDQSTKTAITFEYQAARHITWSLKKEVKSTGEEKTAGTFDSEISKVLEDSSPIEAAHDADYDKALEVSAPLRGRHITRVSQYQTNQEDVNFSNPDLPDEVVSVTETLLQRDLEESGEDIYSTLWDFAGQSVYYATHPLFLTRKAIYCLVYDLSLKPDDVSKPVVKQGLYEEIQDSFNLKTNLDYLHFWMTSVASLVDCQEADVTSEVLPKKLPPVFLVCTHADECFNPRKLARKIFGCLKSKPYGEHLCDVFFVDNTSLSVQKSDCPEVVRLRQKVLAVAKELPDINKAVPIKWLKFEKVLQAMKENLKGNKCISLESAKRMATKVCNITDNNEFDTLMNYLHDLRSLVHFDDSVQLKKLVVLDPQWLVDVFKKVITVRPYDSKEENFEKLWKKLETEGLLDEKLLTHVWDPLIESKETSDILIEIMERFSLLCPWLSHSSGSKEYLVPSMLMSHPSKEILDLIETANIPSLFVKFTSNQVPAGFFPRLIVQFLQWGEEKIWARATPHLFHDFARFYTSSGVCSVNLLCHSSSVEVVVHGGNSRLERRTSADLQPDIEEEMCARQVGRQLRLILEFMRNEFPWLKNVAYELCVLCPVCSSERAVDFCRTHRVKNCKQEQCLHFWSVPQLCSDMKHISCTRSAVAQNPKLQVMQFSPWFPYSGHQLSIDECDGDPFTSDGGNEEKALAVCSSVFDNLSSESCNSKEIVSRLQETLQLDHASLQHPDHETKKWIQCLAREARRSGRLDVVKHLREITPAGTTGPLLSESLDVRKIPFTQARQLSINLTVAGDDKWKFVAEKLGLSQEEICYLDKRTQNPVEGLIGFIAGQRFMSVGELYKVLCDCGVPLIADKSL